MNRIGLMLSCALSAVALTGCDTDTPRVYEGCVKSTNLGEEICRCVADKARDELSQNAMRLLIAGLEDDEKLAGEVREELTVDQAIAAGAFMTRAPLQCAEKGRDKD